MAKKKLSKWEKVVIALVDLYPGTLDKDGMRKASGAFSKSSFFTEIKDKGYIEYIGKGQWRATKNGIELSKKLKEVNIDFFELSHVDDMDIPLDQLLH